MPTNLYESPLGSNPISRYVPLPFAEIGEALARKQKDHDDNQLRLDNHLQDALKIQSIREHDPYRIKYVQKVNDSVGELMQKFPDMGSPEFTREFHRIAREHASDPNLQTLSRSVENYKQQQKHTEALKKDGKYADYNDPYSQGFQGLDENGNPIEYGFHPYEASEDHAKPVYTLFDKMKPSGSERGGFNVDPTTGDIISVKKGGEGIAQDWVDRIAKDNVDHFLTSTSEGKDFARMMSRKGGIKSTQELRGAALQYMQRLGSAYVFNKSSEDSNFQHGPEYKQKEESLPTTNYTTPFENPYELGEEVELGKNGEFVPKIKSGAYTDYNDTYMTSRGPMPKLKSNPLPDKEANVQLQNRLNLLRKNYPGLSNAEYQKRYNGMIKSLKSTTSVYEQNISDTQKEETKRVLQEGGRVGDFGTRPVYIIGKDQKPQLVNPKQLLELTGENYEKGQVVGKLKSRNPLGVASGDVVNILDKNNQPITVVVGRRSLEEEGHFALSNQLAQSTYSLQPVKIQGPGGKVYQSTPRPQFDENGNFQGVNARIHILNPESGQKETFIVNRNGKQVKTDYMSLDELEHIFEKTNPYKK